MEGRPIRFRAWDKKEGCHEMTYGVERDALSPFDFEDIVNDPDRWELMQFTGLVDKNGKEIWEGDRVKVSGNDWYSNDSFCIEPKGADIWALVGVVKMDSYMWIVKLPDEGYVPFFDLINDDLDIEIIGNIYEADRQPQ